jgi:hypothetical protein
VQSPHTVLDERAGIYITSIPGCSPWFESKSIESLSLENAENLKGDKNRVVSCGQREIGVVVKCYSGSETQLKVCDPVDVIGILEIPEDVAEDEDFAVIIHAITVQKKHLSDVVLSNHEPLSSGTNS